MVGPEDAHRTPSIEHNNNASDASRSSEIARTKSQIFEDLSFPPRPQIQLLRCLPLLVPLRASERLQAVQRLRKRQRSVVYVTLSLGVNAVDGSQQRARGAKIVDAAPASPAAPPAFPQMAGGQPYGYTPTPASAAPVFPQTPGGPPYGYFPPMVAPGVPGMGQNARELHNSLFKRVDLTNSGQMNRPWLRCRCMRNGSDKRCRCILRHLSSTRSTNLNSRKILRLPVTLAAFRC